MTDAEKYKNLAAQLRLKARSETSKHVKAELENLAHCYLLLAERNGRNNRPMDTSGPITAS